MKNSTRTSTAVTQRANRKSLLATRRSGLAAVIKDKRTGEHELRGKPARRPHPAACGSSVSCAPPSPPPGASGHKVQTLDGRDNEMRGGMGRQHADRASSLAIRGRDEWQRTQRLASCLMHRMWLHTSGAILPLKAVPQSSSIVERFGVGVGVWNKQWHCRTNK